MIEPKPRLNVKGWMENHNKQKSEIGAHQQNIKLVIGDSIIRHLDKSSTLQKAEAKRIQWVNAGISGDVVENIRWRIRDYAASDRVSKVIIAAGTNNLFKDSAEQIVLELTDAYNLAQEKFPKATIWIQSGYKTIFRREI